MQLDFHADPGEAVRLGLGWAERAGLIAVVEQFRPDYANAVVTSAAEWEREQRLDAARVALCAAAPTLVARSAHEFAVGNPDALFLTVGWHDDEGLRPSNVSGATTDAELLRRWRSLTRHARSSMHRGAIVRNPATGAEQRLPHHLYTPGALALAERGVRMLALAGWVEYQLDPGATGRSGGGTRPPGRSGGPA